MNPGFQKLSDAYARKLAGKSCAECGAHPGGDPALWSAQDVVEHLTLTYQSSIAHVEKYSQRGLPTTRKARWRETAARLLVIDLGYFPRGTASPEFVCPGRRGLAPMDGDALGKLLRNELARLDAALIQCEELFGKGRIASHFRFGPLTTVQWSTFHIVHGRHHLAQIFRAEKKMQVDLQVKGRTSSTS